jgi:diguanylate cyclase (GGDEF)-like protein
VNPSVAKKASRAVRLLMMVLTAVLIFFFINVMLLVSDIQGTARVVNYAGLVRGTTQRIVKLEDAGQPRDDLLRAVDSYINGLRYGSDDLNLVRLDDDEYQAKMTELANYYDELCAEIIHVREVGYENTDIIAMSEEFFGICDDATRLAEDYSQEKASALNYLEGLVIIDIVGLVTTFAVELVRAVRTAALNRELQSKVYLDEATGLPNKNKCEEILGQEHPVSAEAPVALCVFDLNNLHTVNNRFGHEKGDEYIRSFAQQLGRVASEACFVGRDGGDEFIAVLWDADRAAVESRLARVRANVNEYSEAHPDMPISYAVGYALSSDFDEPPTMRELFSQADKNMYIDKNRIKTTEAAGPQRDGR